MNLIDRAILEWAWMSEKGYPDLNNENDLKVFESMFGFELISENAFERQVRQQIVDKFPESLNTMGDDYRIANKGKIDSKSQPLPFFAHRCLHPASFLRSSFSEEIAAQMLARPLAGAES